MAKLILLSIISIVFLSCATEKISEKKSTIEQPTVSIGWNDDDTYTVVVDGETESRAIDRAKHKILKDIVEVRLKNQSPYTDITKIQIEFDIPLRNGKVIFKEPSGNSYKIAYQIHEKGLKKKFERK